MYIKNVPTTSSNITIELNTIRNFHKAPVFLVEDTGTKCLLSVNNISKVLFL